MFNYITTGGLGALVDPDAINKNRITAESLFHVVSRLESTEVLQFERDLRTYHRDGVASDFLIGVLAVAAGEMRDGRKPVTIFNLRSNVIGVLFGVPKDGSKLRSA